MAQSRYALIFNRRETGYWLRLLDAEDGALNQERNALLDESIQLTKIFGAILNETPSPNWPLV